jgi:hypothetical protein
MPLPEVHLIGGTRSEAVKLAPLVAAMRGGGHLTPVPIAGGRYPAIVVQTLAALDIAADVTLAMEQDSASAGILLTDMTRQLDALWSGRPPAAVVVSGDSTTSLATALAAAWRRIPVVDQEAGLRSGDLDAPFPGEANRRLVAQVAALHLAPTPLAAMNLLDENIAVADVLMSGNPATDAMLTVPAVRWPFENSQVTRGAARDRPNPVAAYRRVAQEQSVDRILAAVRQLVARPACPGVPAPRRGDPAVRIADLVDFYAASWIAGDRGTVRYLLAPDAELEWNLDLAIDEEELVETRHRIAQFAEHVTVVSTVCTGGAAALVYDCVAPFGTARMAEFLTVAGGRITGVRQVFDAVALDRFFPGLADSGR